MTVRRTLTAIAAMAATFALLLGGQALAHRAMVSTPLAAAMRLSGVRAYSVSQPGAAPAVVQVHLASGVDLAPTIATLTARLAPILGASVEVVPVGPAQDAMRGAVETLALPVEQGISTGDFVSMAVSVRAQAAALGDAARVEVDARAVYVTVHRRAGGGDAYAVFARTAGIASSGAQA